MIQISVFSFIVCCGAIGDIDKAMSLLREVPTLIFMKDNRLEIFVKRRVCLFSIHAFIISHSKGLGVIILFL